MYVEFSIAQLLAMVSNRSLVGSWSVVTYSDSGNEVTRTDGESGRWYRQRCRHTVWDTYSYMASCNFLSPVIALLVLGVERMPQGVVEHQRVVVDTSSSIAAR